MLSMSLWHVSEGIPFHSSTTLSHNSCTPFGGLGYCCSAFFKCIHRCSMGLRSGDCAGQISTWMWLSSNHCVASLEVCFGSLSCVDFQLPALCAACWGLTEGCPSPWKLAQEVSLLIWWPDMNWGRKQSSSGGRGGQGLVFESLVQPSFFDS